VPPDPPLARQVLGLALVAKAAGPEFGGQRVRGIAQDGSALVISRDYVSHGLRSRAEDLVSIELGPKPEHEIRSALAREVDTELLDPPRQGDPDRPSRRHRAERRTDRQSLCGDRRHRRPRSPCALPGVARLAGGMSRCAGSAVPTSSADPAAAVSATARPQVVPAGIFDFAPRKFLQLELHRFHRIHRPSWYQKSYGPTVKAVKFNLAREFSSADVPRREFLGCSKAFPDR
jgi:hypothetical protein